MEERYFLFHYEDSFDDQYGGTHPFMDWCVLKQSSPLYPLYDAIAVSKEELTLEEYLKYKE